MRALAVEDDPRIAEDLQAALTAAGFRLEGTGEGEEAWFLGDTEEYDLVVLDLWLPSLDGLAVLKRWRANGRTMPVLVLTARGTWQERVEGTEAGADDYLPKPFRMEELIAGGRALVLRAGGHATALQEAGELSLDANRMSVALRGVPVQVTALEYRLLAYLMLHRDRPVPPSELLEHLYGDDDAREANALEAVIARLRRRLGPVSSERAAGSAITWKRHEPAPAPRAGGRAGDPVRIGSCGAGSCAALRRACGAPRGGRDVRATRPGHCRAETRARWTAGTGPTAGRSSLRRALWRALLADRGGQRPRALPFALGRCARPGRRHAG
ncbi:MAG TPA: DNA-binding response regulator [Rhodobacteraceae bacterium]|nr:DNA-binding response regulator [Paracoccaceae bacterium]